MDELQSRLNLQADLEAIQDQIKANGWIIEPWPLLNSTFEATMKSCVDAEVYTLRVDASGYPDAPPSIQCVNPDTKSPNDIHAWPRCQGFRPQPRDLCMPISREGFVAHPEWKNSEHRWKSDGNPIWFVLAMIQDLLNNSGKYHGRN